MIKCSRGLTKCIVRQFKLVGCGSHKRNRNNNKIICQLSCADRVIALDLRFNVIFDFTENRIWLFTGLFDAILSRVYVMWVTDTMISIYFLQIFFAENYLQFNGRKFNWKFFLSLGSKSIQQFNSLFYRYEYDVCGMWFELNIPSIPSPLCKNKPILQITQRIWRSKFNGFVVALFKSIFCLSLASFVFIVHEFETVVRRLFAREKFLENFEKK